MNLERVSSVSKEFVETMKASYEQMHSHFARISSAIITDRDRSQIDFPLNPKHMEVSALADMLSEQIRDKLGMSILEEPDQEVAEEIE